MDKLNKIIKLAEFDGFIRFQQVTTHPSSWGGKPAFYYEPRLRFSKVPVKYDDCYKEGWPKKYDEVQIEWTVPDYFNDLNEIHKLEKKLTGPQWELYAKHIEYLNRANNCLPFINPARVIDAYLVHATADMKAESLGKALQLWE